MFVCERKKVCVSEREVLVFEAARPETEPFRDFWTGSFEDQPYSLFPSWRHVLEPRPLPPPVNQPRAMLVFETHRPVSQSGRQAGSQSVSQSVRESVSQVVGCRV